MFQKSDAHLFFGLILVGCVGCQGLSRVFHQAGTAVPTAAVEHRIILAAAPGAQEPTQTETAPQDKPPTPTNPDEKQESTTSAKPQTADEEIAPIKKPTTQRYTVPSAVVRQVALASVGATAESDSVQDSSLLGSGKEASEATGDTTRGVIGQPGLTAAQPIVAGVVLSQPGLQEGAASALGSASSTNLFTTPGASRTPRVIEGCRALTGAGFFGGDLGACQTRFIRDNQRVPLKIMRK